MINDGDIVEIDGKKYKWDEGYEDSGPSYHEVVLANHKYASVGGWQSWDEIDDAPVRCGKCSGDIFKISSCNSNYDSWAYCPCGNKFTIHTG